MTVKFFEGPAGSGKTTSLLAEVELMLEHSPMPQHKRVLALTFMHGSRRLLTKRLQCLTILKGQYDCMTIDSFAWRIVQRWRSLAKELLLLQNQLQEIDYDSNCSIAASLLDYDWVRDWVNKTYPILIVDEMQDCNGSRLKIIQRLSETLNVLVAADKFQDLNSVESNEAVQWLKTVSINVVLEQNHRTSVEGLLHASRNLRLGEPISRITGKGFTILAPKGPHIAALFLAQNLTWFGTHDTVILTPTAPENSRFVRMLINRIISKPVHSGKSNKDLGPFYLRIESTQDAEERSILASLGIMEGSDNRFDVSSFPWPDGNWVISRLKRWAHRQQRLTGRTYFAAIEIMNQIKGLIQMRRQFQDTSSGLRVMTIHQAKNREFNSVIVLWPYEVSGCDDLKRRRLYNAITRAKVRATIIVQGGEKTLRSPPF